MTERWIEQSQELLKALEEFAEKKEDRLELVNSMIFALNIIDRSIHGWRSWIHNLQLMARFSEKELKEMKEGLFEKAVEFIRYDIQITERHKGKIPRIETIGRKREDRPDSSIIA